MHFYFQRWHQSQSVNCHRSESKLHLSPKQNPNSEKKTKTRHDIPLFNHTSAINPFEWVYYSLRIHSADAVQCNIRRRCCVWVCGSRFAKRRPSVCVSGGRCQGFMWRSSHIWLTILLSSSAQPWWLTTPPKSFFLSFFFPPFLCLSFLSFYFRALAVCCPVARLSKSDTATLHWDKTNARTSRPKSLLYPTRLQAQKCLGTQM